MIFIKQVVCYVPAIALAFLLGVTACGERKSPDGGEVASSTSASSGSSKIEQTDYVTSEIGEKIQIKAAPPFPKIVLSSGSPMPLPPEPTPWEPAEAFKATERNCMSCHNDFIYKEILLSVRAKAISSIEATSPKPMPPLNSKPYDYQTFKESTEGMALLNFLKSQNN